MSRLGLPARAAIALTLAGSLVDVAACSRSSGTAASASATAESRKPAKSSAIAATSASAKPAPPVDTTPADIAFFKGDLPANVKLPLGAGSMNLGFTIKRPESWTYGGLPGDEMMMISKDGSAAIFCVYPGEGSDEDGVAATLKHAPILGTDYKQLSKNADVPIGPSKWPARTGYGSAKVFGGDGEVYWIRADMTLFLLALKKSATPETREEAMAIARSMTAPKAAPP